MKPAHHTENGFRNLDPEAGPRPPLSVIKWMLTRKAQGKPPAAMAARSYPEEPLPPAAMRVFWIGHSSLLVEFGGGPRVLIDPHFSERCSPFERLGPKRFHPPGIALQKIPAVDAVLISHNHYDHLDEPTIRQLLQRYGSQLQFVVPLKLGSWFRKHGATRVTELDWWQTTQLGALQITATPAQHWSRRGFGDTNRSLWCGYRLDYDQRSLYFAGDSGYFAGYKEIGERLGPVDIAALPIGAYEPRWFMKPAHQDPDEAVQAYRDVRARVFMAIHHNTFPLTDEAPAEPAIRLKEASRKAGLNAKLLWIPDPGEYRLLSAD